MKKGYTLGQDYSTLKKLGNVSDVATKALSFTHSLTVSPFINWVTTDNEN